jgi:hypothetical protein
MPTPITLKNSVTCPHCWTRFKPEQSFWIAEDPDIPPEASLGEGHGKRFAPLRFDLAGDAYDEKGARCKRLACPRCRQEIPREIFETTALFWSMVGHIRCGKSYLLASMTSRLRDRFPSFQLAFNDPHPLMNQTLKEYEAELQHGGADKIVRIDKTLATGDQKTTNRILERGRLIEYARPFIFSIRPLSDHPKAADLSEVATLLCLYDNAGELFLPIPNPGRAMNHIAESGVLMFLFDPTLDTTFREACQDGASDPQLVGDNVQTADQLEVLNELARRVRQLRNYSAHQKHPGLLFVLVTKYDAWGRLLGEELKDPWRRSRHHDIYGLDVEYVESISQRIRGLLRKYAPRIVAAAEDFGTHVVYLPVSATGGPPEDIANIGLAFRPEKIKPIWVEVPALYALCRGTMLVPRWVGENG